MELSEKVERKGGWETGDNGKRAAEAESGYWSRASCWIAWAPPPFTWSWAGSAGVCRSITSCFLFQVITGFQFSGGIFHLSGADAALT